MPLTWDVSLIVLVICAASLTRAPRPAGIRQPLGYPIVAFLGVSAIAVLASPQRDEIAHLSISLLPATLLFFLIADGFRSSHHTRALYLTFSIVSLALCSWLMWNAWLDGPVSPNVWVLHAGTPLLVVGNDVTFFAVIAPMSLVGLCSIRSIAPRAICATALLSTIVVIVLFESRGAVLTLIASLGCIALLIRPRVALTAATLLAAAIVTVDAVLGFPLIEKVGDLWTNGDLAGRTTLWKSGFSAFLESPVLGHGPHSVRYLASHGTDTVRWAHNLYLDVLAGQGLLGFATFAAVVGGALILARQTHTQASDDDARLLNAGALSALVGLLLAAIWEISFLRLWVVVTFFALIGVIAHLWTLGRAGEAGQAGEAGRPDRARPTGSTTDSTGTTGTRDTANRKQVVYDSPFANR